MENVTIFKIYFRLMFGSQLWPNLATYTSKILPYQAFELISKTNKFGNFVLITTLLYFRVVIRINLIRINFFSLFLVTILQHIFAGFIVF